MTIISSVNKDKIVEALRSGEIAIIPTDTVYGVAATLDDPATVTKMARLKGRHESQPVALLIDSVETIEDHLEDASVIHRIERFWPGALTVIVRARADSQLREPVISTNSDGCKTVGLRQPDDDLVRAVIRDCGGALAVTSANYHGEPPVTTAIEADGTFEQDLLVLDGGPRIGNEASTVVDLSVIPMRLLREGSVKASDLEILRD